MCARPTQHSLVLGSIYENLVMGYHSVTTFSFNCIFVKFVMAYHCVRFQIILFYIHGLVILHCFLSFLLTTMKVIYHFSSSVLKSPLVFNGYVKYEQG